MEKWVRVSKGRPCQICGRPDWCTIWSDGSVACCMRIPSEKKMKNGGYLHRLTSEFRFTPRMNTGNPQKNTPVLDKKTLVSMNNQYVLNCSSERLIPFARSLGVSMESLRRLETGYLGHDKWTFPMKNGADSIIGIRIRCIDGKKYCVEGSKNGLFIPVGVSPRDNSPLIICEGPTDCAALLDLGFDAIGRPSCNSGTDYVKQFLMPRLRDVFIMADNDSPKQAPDGRVFCPGQEGAIALAAEIRELTKSVVVIKPPEHKDIRAWYNAGASREDVLNLVRNRRFLFCRRI